MPEIRLEHITKRWGKFYGVDDLNLVIENNAFVTLLGPSGCGKTTTLRMIAGLETPTSGRITIGDTVVFDSELGINIPANKRKVGFLFQNYALWPNMTVYQNISFGLSNIKEEMPKISFEAKNAARLAQILKNPQDVVKTLEECRDKNGKLDEKKAITKLIDTYTISQYTAQKLFGYHLEQGKDVSAEVKALEEKVEAARKAQPFNENFELLKDGKVETAVRKLTKEEIDLSVRRVSRIVKISMFMDRYPAELSGGQQQRVAIARTLAPEPSVLFMDEPLSNLDAKLRLEMRYELQRLHVETGSTFVYVTHDQMEAMTLATQICLMNNGVLQQYAAPLEVYNHPANLFAADFVGNPSINFVEAKGWQGPEGSIELTLLRAAASPEMASDQGEHRFRYGFTAWSESFAQAPVVQQAAAFNDPVWLEAGSLQAFSAFSTDAANVVIDTVKRADDESGDLILRLYESKKADTYFHIRSDLPVETLIPCDLLETPVGRAAALKAELHVRPFEVSTYRIKLRE